MTASRSINLKSAKLALSLWLLFAIAKISSGQQGQNAEIQDTDYATSDGDLQLQTRNSLIGTITQQDAKSITFITSNRTAEMVNVTDWTKGGELSHVAQLSPEFQPQTHSLLRGSYLDNTILPSMGLVHTVISAYKDHHNLVLTPDDIWITILVQFSRFVNANAEKMRHYFVSHNGTQTIEVHLKSLVGSGGDGRKLTAYEWAGALKHIREKLADLTHPRLDRFIAANFTTSQTRHQVISKLVFLSTMQHYFKYVMPILCGIPQVTILGTLEDWIEIRARIETLGTTFGPIPAKWSRILGPIIDQFVRAKRGDVDGEFWADMVKIKDNSVCGGGEKEHVLDGWLSAFAVFDGEGNWRGEKMNYWKWPRINMKYVPSGVITVPVQVVHRQVIGADKTQKATFFAGHMGTRFSKDHKTLSPYTGWAIAYSN